MFYQDDNYEATISGDSIYDAEKNLEDVRSRDRGYNVIYRKAERISGRNKGRIYNKKIRIYTTSGTGSNIRDAETGQYYSNIVGSKDENLFFKVILATGECKSANKSSTLFYLSPQHYANHLLCHLSDEIIHNWEEKRDKRLSELKIEKKSNMNYVEVR